MKLVTYLLDKTNYDPQAAMLAPRQRIGNGGVLLNDKVYNLTQVCEWVQHDKGLKFTAIPHTLQAFVELDAATRLAISQYSKELPHSNLEGLPLASVQLRAPFEIPTSVRDFMAFELHVKNSRANRGQTVPPEWYKVPVFYFTNHHAIYGPDDFVPYPHPSKALDFELELACVLGRAGRDIPAASASDYIAGYFILTDWSARDLQMVEMAVGLGPAKGKDFATSLGPCMVTPDELEPYRVNSGAEERYDLAMTARLNGKEISRGNFKDIYFSFPQMIERASANVWLMPGDILGSGTVGTGCLLEQGDKRESWLLADDVLELEIDHIGVLRNTVKAI